jgi:hypothetical protein
MGGKWKHCRLSGRTSRCSRQGRHSGFLEYTVLPASPAAELCRSATFADGDRTGDVRTGRAEFIRCDQGRTWSSSTAKQGARNFLSGWKILRSKSLSYFFAGIPTPLLASPFGMIHLGRSVATALEARPCSSTTPPVSVLTEEARAAGYCVRTLERAKRRLGVAARPVQKDGRALWLWSNSTLPHGAGRRR